MTSNSERKALEYDAQVADELQCYCGRSDRHTKTSGCYPEIPKLSNSMGLLYAALKDGEWHSSKDLLAVLRNARARPVASENENRILRVQMHYLRERVSGFAKIESKKKIGYRLIVSQRSTVCCEDNTKESRGC